MLRHFIHIAGRNARRFKTTFFINLAGLSTGLACVLLIYLWVNDELHVDKFNKNDDRLYVVMKNQPTSAGIITNNFTSALLTDALKDEFPEVEDAVPYTKPMGYGEFTLTGNDKNIKAIGLFAGENFFEMFSFPLLSGDKKEVLNDLNSVVLSETLADKLFGSPEKAIGKRLRWELTPFKSDVVISGVFKNVPENASNQFDFVLSFNELKRLIGPNGINWDNNFTVSCLLLKKGTDVSRFNGKLRNYMRSKIRDSDESLFVTRYSGLYLHGKYENGIQSGGRITYVKLFSVIALLVLLIACINFMNLSTARATARAREVGIKKAIGAGKGILIFQYLSESIVISFLAMIFSVIIVELILPRFRIITGKLMVLPFEPGLFLVIFTLTVLTGLAAGSYPAFYLSGFKPVTTLKGRIKGSAGELWARKGLVVFQFTLSILLMCAVWIVYKQIEYVEKKDLGYDKDNIIYFERNGNLLTSLEPFLSEVRNLPGVKDASAIGTDLVKRNNYTSGIDWEGKTPDESIPFENVTVDFGMIETLGVKMKEGRAFSTDHASDSSAIIFNQAAIDVMGLHDPVGKTVRLWGEPRKIIGVTENFNFESLHEKIKPLFFWINPDRAGIIMIRIAAGKEHDVLPRISKVFRTFNPGFSFDYNFQDQAYKARYVAEDRISELSRYFAGLAIIISCLGLFGLSSFTAERRLKEIGIRKILGASQFGILRMLSTDFTRLVIIAILIALPASYFIASHWLEGYAYRINLSPWYFLGVGFLALVIAWITIGMHTIRASRINPAHCLKEE